MINVNCTASDKNTTKTYEDIFVLHFILKNPVAIKRVRLS